MPNSPKGLHQQKYYEKEGAAASFFLKIPNMIDSFLFV